MATDAQIEAFKQHWFGSEAAERSNSQLFLTELTDLMGVEHPSGAINALQAVAAVFALHVQNPYSRAYLEPDGVRHYAGEEAYLVGLIAGPIQTPLGATHYLFSMRSWSTSLRCFRAAAVALALLGLSACADRRSDRSSIRPGYGSHAAGRGRSHQEKMLLNESSPRGRARSALVVLHRGSADL